MRNWILTHSGIQFDLEAPDPSMICIEDIAHALSHMCRFNGHSDTFYSVAHHSLLVSAVLPQEHRLAGLMHDATEAYLPDVTAPLKAMMPEFRAIEKRVWKVIAARFGLPEVLPPEVKDADMRMLKTEKLAVFSEEASRHAWNAAVEGLVPYTDSLVVDGLRDGAPIEKMRETFLEVFESLHVAV